jgi:hypothetical protein
MTLDRGRHRDLGTLPQRGAAFNVREEKGDGAAGEIGHDPTQYERLVVALVDCRTVEGRRTSEQANVSSFAPTRYAEQVRNDDGIVLRLTAEDAVAMAAD